MLLISAAAHASDRGDGATVGLLVGDSLVAGYGLPRVRISPGLAALRRGGIWLKRSMAGFPAIRQQVVQPH